MQRAPTTKNKYLCKSVNGSLARAGNDGRGLSGRREGNGEVHEETNSARVKINESVAKENIKMGNQCHCM